jgi:two-component system chemotaxis sensor kinase CheA
MSLPASLERPFKQLFRRPNPCCVVCLTGQGICQRQFLEIDGEGYSFKWVCREWAALHLKRVLFMSADRAIEARDRDCRGHTEDTLLSGAGDVDVLDDIFKEFLVESYENLDQLDQDLIALEDTPDDRDCLASVFRTVHTIKGTSGFLALPKLERVAHVGENLLVPLRDGELDLSRDIADGLLAMVDAIREILGHIESGEGEGDGEYEALVVRLEQLLANETATASGEAPAGTSLSDEELSDVVSTMESTAEVVDAEAAETEAAAAGTPGQKIKTTRRDSGKKTTEATSELEVADDDDAEVASPQDVVDEAPAVAAEAAPQKIEAAKASKEAAASESPKASSSIADQSVRIDVDLLDRLMNLVGELVLARNQILQFTSDSEDVTLAAASQRLNLITTELQEGVMKTRMQPIKNAWNKLPRVVRDLSASCGKKVEVRMEGEETELDKTILEAIKDPLTHIVRNSVDHGIESPEDRVANGKPTEGTLCLRAFHESGQVNIEIIDDGGGINVDRVRQKGVEKGLITAEQAAAMSDREATNLILLPGFSTAQKVTNVSGRGVGMDVVKTNIERISGTLEIHSIPGQGTTLRIKIPLTLAIVPALVVQAAGGQYAIPQVSLLELVRLEASRVKDEIEFIHDAPVYRLRGNLLPLVYLDEQLDLRSKRARHEHNQTVNIVVLQAEDRQFGLVVDAVTDTQEIVVKPLSGHLKNIAAYAGSTIMGDGSVALILDVLGVAQRGSILAELHDQALRGNGGALASDANATTEPLLVVDPGDGSPVAVRLSTVARLEEFQQTDIERSGHSEVVQYRGHIMPLIHLQTSGYGMDTGSESGRVPVVVFTSGEQSVGIVVGRVIDIVQHALTDDSDGLVPGSHVISGRVTELLDLEEFVRSTMPQVFA